MVVFNATLLAVLLEIAMRPVDLPLQKALEPCRDDRSPLWGSCTDDFRPADFLQLMVKSNAPASTQMATKARDLTFLIMVLLKVCLIFISVYAASFAGGAMQCQQHQFLSCCYSCNRMYYGEWLGGSQGEGQLNFGY